jgi:hypothetical protein
MNYALPFLGANGPRTYLIAGENNAEMRAQGAVLSLAQMHTQNGTFGLDNTGSVDSIEPTTAVSVPIPSGTADIFGGYQPTSLWQSVNASPNFPFSAQVMQAMYLQGTGVHVNGVIGLDVPALEGLLTLTGPVVVPNIPVLISATNVAQVLLHDQYLQYAAGSAQGQRHDNVSAVAKAIVDQMKYEHVDLAALANALATDVSGGHLMVWDEVPQFESTMASVGAAGTLDQTLATRTFHVALENSTATKLDYYVNDAVDVKVTISPNGDAFVNTKVAVTNTTPAGLGPTFQTGPDNINSFTPGQYVGRVLLWSPQGSDAPGSVLESGLQANQIQTSILPQQSKSVTFGTVIPHAVVRGQLKLRFVPQPRLVPSKLRIEVTAPGWHLGGTPQVDQFLVGTSAFSWTLSK